MSRPSLLFSLRECENKHSCTHTSPQLVHCSLPHEAIFHSLTIFLFFLPPSMFSHLFAFPTPTPTLLWPTKSSGGLNAVTLYHPWANKSRFYSTPPPPPSACIADPSEAELHMGLRDLIFSLWSNLNPCASAHQPPTPPNTHQPQRYPSRQFNHTNSTPFSFPSTTPHIPRPRCHNSAACGALSARRRLSVPGQGGLLE